MREKTDSSYAVNKRVSIVKPDNKLQADFLLNFLSESVAFLVHPGFKTGKEVGPFARKGVEHDVPAVVEQTFFIGDFELAVSDRASEQLIDSKLLARRSS